MDCTNKLELCGKFVAVDVVLGEDFCGDLSYILKGCFYSTEYLRDFAKELEQMANLIDSRSNALEKFELEREKE